MSDAIEYFNRFALFARDVSVCGGDRLLCSYGPVKPSGRRGLNDPLLVTSDGAPGIIKAIEVFRARRGLIACAISPPSSPKTYLSGCLLRNVSIAYQ